MGVSSVFKRKENGRNIALPLCWQCVEGADRVAHGRLRQPGFEGELAGGSPKLDFGLSGVVVL
jgi:hypothetical protein